MKHSLRRTLLLAAVLTLAAVQPAEAGKLRRLVYSNIPASGAITNLTVNRTNTSGTVVFPDLPDLVEYMPPNPPVPPFTLESIWNNPGPNNYGSYARGYLTAPETGDYVFWVYGDDDTYFYLNTDSTDPLNPAKTNLIAYVAGSTSPRQWTKYAAQKSAPVRLEQGKIYYMELLHMEGGGQDGLGLGWQLPSGTQELPVPAWHFQPVRDTRWSETEVEAVLGPARPKSTNDVNIYDGSEAVVYANINLDLPVTYQWLKAAAGSSTFNPVAGATGAFLKFRPGMADDNSQYQVRATSGGNTYTSQAVLLTVFQDVPTLISAGFAPGNPYRILVAFSEDVSPATAQNKNNYILDKGVAVQSATIQSDGRTVALQVSGVTPATGYVTLTINGVQDMATPPNTIAANTRATFVYTDQVISFHTYTPTAGSNIDLLIAWLQSSNYLNWVVDDARYIPTNTYQWNYNPAKDNYQGQWIGYITPATTGSYTFGLASDDHGLLFLSTNDQRANKVEIARTTGSTGRWSLSNFVTQISAPITLQGGQRYYIEAVYRDGTGGDGVSVFWTTPENPGPLPVDNVQANVQPYSIPASVLSAYRSFSAVAITNQPVPSISALEGTPVTLTVGPLGVDGIPVYYYQWMREGVAVPGANSYSFTIPRVPLADHNARYWLVVSNAFSSATSSVVTLSVNAESIKPTFRFPLTPKVNTTPNEVRLAWSEPVDPATATNVANYSITTDSGALTITNIVLSADAMMVTLTTSPQVAGKIHTITVNNVKDTAATPNAVEANSKDYFFFAVTSGRFVQRADGMVIMEGENATRRTTGRTDGKGWVEWTAAGSFSGRGYMVVTNGTGGGTAGGDGTRANCAALEFDITFDRIGRHIIWIRGWNENTATSGNDDSLFVAFDGLLAGYTEGKTALGDSYLQSWGAAAWQWRSDRNVNPDPMIFTNAATGLHTFAVWHREDGTLVDKVIIEYSEPPRTTSNTAAPGAATSNGGLGDVETFEYVGAAPPGPPTIAITSPTNTQSFAAGATITITTTTSSGAGLSQVEFFSGTNLLGVVSAAPYNLTLTNVAEGVYSLTARATDFLGQQSTSTAVTVIVDSTKPVAYAVGSLGGTGIGVYFRDVSGLDPASANTAGNYTVNNGAVTVTQAALEPDGRAVMLLLSAPITGPFSVRVQNVKDLGFGPNTVDPVTLESEVVSYLANTDVGTPGIDPAMTGLAQAIGTAGYYVRAGGTDIWNTTDGMHFVYKTITNDFDVAARVEGLLRPDPWSKAGIMVRETLEGGARNHLIAAAPTNGQNLITMQWRTNLSSVSVSIADAVRPRPAPIPNAWLRVKRVGQQFDFYYGTNGVDWVTLWSTNMAATAYPAEMYVGLATTSHNNNADPTNTTAAYYRDLRGFGEPVSAQPPTLGAKVVGTSLQITWTSATPTFVLQSTPTLSAPNWQPASGTTATNGNTYTATVPIGLATEFFRLRSP